MKRGWINLNLKFFSFLIILVGLLSACNSNTELKESKEPLVEIYSIALDTIMAEDGALNSDMEFIAIDMSNFEDLDESDKEEILSYFKKKYKVSVMDATFEQLKEKGLYNFSTMALDGVLLRIEKVDFESNNEIVFQGSKYRASEGAIGIEFRVHYKDDKWEAKEVRLLRIS